MIELLRFRLGERGLALRLDAIERFLEEGAQDASLPEALGLPAGSGVLVEVGGRRIALGARGRVEQVAPETIRALPAPLSAHPAITGLVFLSEESAPLLLVDPGRVA